jgi:hypothetical protein
MESNLSKDTSLQIITTGSPDLEAITQMNFLARRYGFSYHPIGCVVTASKGDSIRNVNGSTYKILERRFGKEWKNNLYSQLDTLNHVRQVADSLLHLQINSTDEKYFYYLVMPDTAKNQFHVKVYSTDSLNGKSELMVHYKMNINLKPTLQADISQTFEKLQPQLTAGLLP